MIKELLFSLLIFSPNLLLADSTEIECLTQNIYHEARDQPIHGQIAVAHVTLNRVKDYRYPETICKVVRQGYKKNRKDCQFSWYCDGKSDKMYEIEEKELANKIAISIIQGKIKDNTYGSTHYHATRVNPYWSASLTKTIAIQDHIFYRWDRKRNKK